MRTRYMTIERELQKRDRLLRSLVQLRQSNSGLGIDMVDKLREERNLLPLYRRKVQEIQEQIEERDVDMKQMKRNLQFTHILELQMELASWQHEARRLSSLCLEPSLDSNVTAQKEVDVHLQRVSQLEVDLQNAEQKRSTLQQELADVEADHTSAESIFKEQEQELIKQQDLTRELAVAFKQLLQARKQAEVLQEEIYFLDVSKQRHEQEVVSLKERINRVHDVIARQSSSLLAFEKGGCLPISKSVLYATLLPNLPVGTAERLGCLRHASNYSFESVSLFTHLQKLESARTGVLARSSFEAGLQSWPNCPLAVEEATDSLISIMPVPAESIAWLDVLVALECFGSSSSSSAPNLPEIRSLRTSCLRKHVGTEKLKDHLLALKSFHQAEHFFGSGCLHLPEPEFTKWMRAWQSLGSQILLLHLPLSAATLSAAAMEAWYTRCFDSVRSHRRELVESFTVWRNDMMLTEEQFQMVCLDVLGADLTDEDIADLGLMACQDDSTGPEKISGDFILKLQVPANSES